MAWTEWRPFTDYFDILPYVGHAGNGGGVWRTQLEGVNATLSRSEGLRPVAGGVFDYDKFEIPIGVYQIRVRAAERCEKCVEYYEYIGMAAGLGKVPKFQQGIFHRVYDHYRKLVLLPHRGKIGEYIRRIHGSEMTKSECHALLADQKFADYQCLRDFFIDASGENVIANDTPSPWVDVFTIYKERLRTHADIEEFFSELVEFRFNHLPGSPAHREKTISKWEGLALREYFHRHGDYPFLNSKNEAGTALDGF